MQYRTGQNGAATFGGAALSVVRWQVRPTAAVVEFRNSRSGAVPRRGASGRDAEVVLDLDYDLDADPYAAGLAAGATASAVKLYPAGAGGAYWDFPSLVVEESPQTLDVGGRIATRVTCRADGPFGYPGSPVPPPAG